MSDLGDSGNVLVLGTEDRLAIATTDAIRGGDTEGLTRLLAEHPGLAKDDVELLDAGADIDATGAVIAGGRPITRVRMSRQRHRADRRPPCG